MASTEDSVRAVRGTRGIRHIRRPGGRNEPELDLAYLRERPGVGPVALVIPGGPGVAVPLMYRRFRTRAAAAGIDVIMVEHRGVGLSRQDTDGRDLPPHALSVPHVVADLAAALDAERLDRVIVTGTSYGSYLAAAFAVTHPDRLAGLVLDSATLSANEADIKRDHARALLWHGQDPATAATAERLRRLVLEHGLEPQKLGRVARTLFEFGGTDLLDTYLDQLVRDRARTTTAMLHRLQTRETQQISRHVMEFDLVAQIAYGELHWGMMPDHGIFDPAFGFCDENAPAFTGEHYDLRTQLQEVNTAALVLTGDRDLRTPPPVAAEAADRLPDGALVTIPGHGHSALDTRPTMLLDAIGAIADGTHLQFPSRASRLAATAPTAGAGRFLPPMVRASLAADRLRTPFPQQLRRSPRGTGTPATAGAAAPSS